jgi:hypothetical protein
MYALGLGASSKDLLSGNASARWPLSGQPRHRHQPANTGWQCDLPVSRNKLEDVAADGGDLAAVMLEWWRGPSEQPDPAAPSDLDRSRRFYRDLLGLAIYREFGPPDDPGLVFYTGRGLLEVSGHAVGRHGRSVMIWLQVRDVHAEHARLAAAGVPIVREPVAE